MDIACTLKKGSPVVESMFNMIETLLLCPVPHLPENILLKKHTKIALGIFCGKIFFSFCIFQSYNNDHELFWEMKKKDTTQEK